MILLKISNGKVEIRKTNGSFIKTLVSKGAVNAQLNEDQSLALITLSSGRAEIRKVQTGSHVKTFTSRNVVNGKWVGDDVALELANGKTEIRKQNGSFIRTI